MTISILALLLVAAAPTVHTVTASPEGLSVNGYLVEGPTGVVAIDSALTISDGRALRARLDALKKPLLAVLLTHGHPDHYNGVAPLIEGSKVPVYATAAVTQVIREYDAAKEKQWKPVFKDEWPATRAFPNKEVKSGDKLTFDGMTFVVNDVGAGESHADSYWILEGSNRAAFIGDMVLNGSHAYTNDGHTQEWLATLARSQKALKGIKQIFPGHGPGGDVSMLAWQSAYLSRYRTEVDALRAGAPSLSEAAKKTLEERMKAAYPEAGNVFMITLGADTVAGELAKGRR